MKPKLLLCLALVLSGGLFNCSGKDAIDPETGLPLANSSPPPALTNSTDYIARTSWFQKPGVGISLPEFQAAVRQYELDLSKSNNASASSTNLQPSFESLLHSTSQDKKWTDGIDRLPLALRNQLAVAAARELSLVTTNGDQLTNGEPNLIYRKPLSRRTVAEEAMVRLESDNGSRVEFLHEIVGRGLVTDQNVIPPLIEMLDEPNRIISDEASGTLSLLTWRLRDINARNYFQKPELIAAWWREWWVRNHNKNVIMDKDILGLARARITAIEWRLRQDVTNSYIMGLPDSFPETRFFASPELSDDEIDGYRVSDNSNSGYSDRYYLRIAAKFATPSLFKERGESDFMTPELKQKPKEEILREEIPGTDLVVVVEAAAIDDDFVSQLRRSLKKLPPMPNSVEEARRQLEEVKAPDVAKKIKAFNEACSAMTNDTQSSPAYLYNATSELLDTGTEEPVIIALTNGTASVRNAIFAVVNFHSFGPEAVPAFLFLLKDADPQIRAAAANHLGQTLGQNETRLSALAQTLSDPDSDVRFNAISALEDMADATLRDESPEFKMTVAGSAYRAQEKILAPAIIQAMSDTNAAVREKAVKALGGISRICMGYLAKVRNDEDARMEAVLIGALKDDNTEVRTAAVKALKYFGAAAKEALPALIQFTNQANSTLKTAAADTYKSINAAVKTEEQKALVAEKYPRLVMKEAIGAIKKIDSTRWTDETNVVPGIKSPPMLVKKATFELLTSTIDPELAKMLNQKIDPPEHLADVPVVAFKIPQSGKVWIGWQMDFYVETESNIIGGMLTYWGYVNWHTNLAVEPFDEDLNQAIDRFEQRISDSRITGASNRQTDIDSQTRERSPVLNGLYEIPGATGRVMPQFVGLDVETNTLRLDLENPDTGKQASYWIDLKTRKVGNFSVRDN